MSIPPGAPQPSYILRGHATPIHVAKFIRGNTRLVTGDAEGWVVMWSLESRRGTAVWRAHEGVLLGVGEWGEGVVTHGKDNKLIIWKLPPSEEEFMSKILPVDTVSEERRKPWILHLLDVNTMNFCAFAMCRPLDSDIKVEENGEKGKDETAEAKIQKDEKGDDQLLIAVPNTLTSDSIDIFHIPTLHRLHNIPSPGPEKPGMIMCLSLFFHPITKCLTVLSGYEDGSVSIFSLTSPISPFSTSPSTAPSSRSPQWNTIYHSKSHTQPILSLSLEPSPDRKFFLTSGADDRIIKYLIPTTTTPFCPSPSPPASHSEAMLSSSKDEPKILKTAHAGQQSIEMRNDGKIAVTAGWDGRARVYGVAKMRELAVLKWHTDGCFAVAVADVLEGAEVESGGGEKGKELVGRLGQLDVKGERLRKARETHWVAVGGKDGKVSLWDVY